MILLPQPRTSGALSLEEAITRRRSERAFSTQPLSQTQIGQLLWAAQGITDTARPYRAVPSAGALYPLEVLLVAVHVTDLPAGVYRYAPEHHALVQMRNAVPADELLQAALAQSAVAQAPAVLAITAVSARTTRKYGARGERYVHLEAGHAAQNVYLQAEALELGTVAVGAFDDEGVRRALALRADERPLYLMPVGKPAQR